MPSRSASLHRPLRSVPGVALLLLLAGGAAADAADAPAPPTAEAPQEQDEKFGLSEAQRKQVFIELADAEDRAEREAAQQSRSDPDSEAQAALTDRLLKRYRAAIGKAYGLSNEQLVEIQAEGFEKNWRIVLQ